MPQLNAQVPNDASIEGLFTEDTYSSREQRQQSSRLVSDSCADSQHQPIQLDSVMSELNRLSKSFVSSYQNLEGQVEKLSGQLLNETEQKKNAMQEKQKLQSEKAFLSERLQNLLSIMPAGVVVIDGQGKVKDCNAKAVDILGRPLLGELWISVIKRAFQPQADDGHQVSLKDGRKIHIETRALDVEPGQLLVLTDLTKSCQLQTELTQQQKLSSMGKMIASLAHQIRTPLSAAILYGSHLNKNNIKEELKQKFSDQLLERLHFMERQINDMLNFVRGERKQKSSISPQSLFKELKKLSNDLPDFVSLNLVEDDYKNNVLVADPDAVIGAIMNLIENACDACKKEKFPSVKVTFSVSDKLSICIEDNGKGISKEEQKKIFEPFYTTKKSGNGLGLAIVHGIVIDHSGKINVTSETTTCFEIQFPLVTEPPVTSINLSQEKAYDF